MHCQSSHLKESKLGAALEPVGMGRRQYKTEIRIQLSIVPLLIYIKMRPYNV